MTAACALSARQAISIAGKDMPPRRLPSPARAGERLRMPGGAGRSQSAYAPGQAAGLWPVHCAHAGAQACRRLSRCLCKGLALGYGLRAPMCVRACACPHAVGTIACVRAEGRAPPALPARHRLVTISSSRHVLSLPAALPQHALKVRSAHPPCSSQLLMQAPATNCRPPSHTLPDNAATLQNTAASLRARAAAPVHLPSTSSLCALILTLALLLWPPWLLFRPPLLAPSPAALCGREPLPPRERRDARRSDDAVVGLRTMRRGSPPSLGTKPTTSSCGCRCAHVCVCVCTHMRVC